MEESAMETGGTAVPSGSFDVIALVDVSK